MMRSAFPLEAKLPVVFVVGAIGLLVAVALAAHEGTAYLRADRQGDRLRALDSAVTSLYLSVRIAESTQRGFLLTGNEAYLRPYATASARVAQQYADAQALAADDPPTAAALGRVRTQIDVRLADLADVVEARKAGNLDAVQNAVLSERGGDQMRAIARAWEGIHGDLNARATAMQANLHDHFDEAWHLMVAGATLALLLLAVAYIAIAREVGQRRRLAERMRREADHDELTQLPNRRFFAQWLGYALAQARRTDSTLGLLCIDIDGFKKVNDTCGHEAGDALLVEIARRFESLKRDSDVLARVGGDEFVLAAAGATDGRDLALLANRLIDSLSDPPISSPLVGASIGIAFYPDDASDAQSLFATADAAMYAAKHAGKNCVVFHAVAGIPVRDRDAQRSGTA